MKGPYRERQVYYPIPNKQLDPNNTYPGAIPDATMRALKDIRLSHWKTTYQKDYDRTNTSRLNVDYVETLSKITALPNAKVSFAACFFLLHLHTPYSIA